MTGHRYELRYIRDKEKREVDFLLLKDRKPLAMYECKWADTNISQSLKYYSKKLKLKKIFQLVADFDKILEKDGITVISAYRYLSQPLELEP